MNSIVWQRKILSNSMRLLLLPKPWSMTAQLSVAVEYGSNFENEADAGMAHFQEHMTAGGSEKHIERSRRLEQMGGYVDFSTANEDTMIITDVLPDKIGKTAQVLSDLLFDSDFEEKKLASERKIILHEIAEAEDDPWGSADELLRKCLYENHPVRRPVLGFRKTVSQLSLDSVKEVHRVNYVPQKTLLILTGNFKDETVEAVRQKFERVERTGAVSQRKPFTEEGKPRKESVKVKAGITQTYMCMGAKTAAAKHPDTPVLNVIDTLMGAGASSRLFIELREKKALAYSIDSTNEYGSDYGFFHIDCAVNSKHMEETKRLLLQELEKLKREKVPEAELNKAKDMIVGTVLRTVDSPVDFPQTMAVMEMQFGDQHALQDYLDQINAVSAQDIVMVANKYLNEENFSTAVICPKT
jgi:predicted Zn-dependent peptidase